MKVLASIGIVIVVIVLLGVAYVMRENLMPLQTRKLEKVNPTSQSFSLPLKEVRERLIDAFSIDSQIRNRRVFTFKGSWGSNSVRELTLSLETKEKALFGREVFEDPKNKYDIFLHMFGDPITSRTYFVSGRPLGYRASFHLHLTSETDGNTSVSVRVVRPTVIKGIGGVGPHGFYSKDVPVPPTTIEEYELLRYVGNVLGEGRMPDVQYPR